MRIIERGNLYYTVNVSKINNRKMKRGIGFKVEAVAQKVMNNPYPLI